MYNVAMLIRDIIKLSISAIWVFIWITGIVIAKGFISTSFAICTGGLYSLYLVIEKYLPLI